MGTDDPHLPTRCAHRRQRSPLLKAGCPPVETAIMVFLKNEPPRTFKILARINEVTFDHVYNLIENPLPCC